MSEQGLDAPLDEIARRAGVGNATLYRRFPTRIDLVVAVFAERMAEHVGQWKKPSRSPTLGRGYGLHHGRRRPAGARSRDRRPGHAGRLERAGHRTASCPGLPGVQTLIDRAKAAGTLRATARPKTFSSCSKRMQGLIERSNRAAASASQRLVHLLLDGLRADAATVGPPPPSPRRMRAAMRERSREFGLEVPARRSITAAPAKVGVSPHF